MLAEINECLKLIEQADNNCKDALFAYWDEKDAVDKDALWLAYLKFVKTRKYYSARLIELTKSWEQ